MAHIAERNTSHYLASLLRPRGDVCPEATQLAMYLREVKPQLLFGVPRVWEKLYGRIQAAVSGDPERAKKLKEAVDAALPLVEKIQAGTATDQEKGIYQFLDDVAFKNLRALIGLDKRARGHRRRADDARAAVVVARDRRADQRGVRHERSNT